MIDITLSPSQKAIHDKAADFASTVLLTASTTYEAHLSQKERFRALRPFYSQAVKAGLIKGLIPKAFGGTAGTLVEAALLVEQLCKHDRSLSLTIFSTGLGLSSLLIAGTQEQREVYLRPFLSGEGEPLASLLHTEPEGVANWLEKGGSGLRTLARREGDEWVVSGDKIWATSSCGWDDLGPDLMCVVCRYSQDGTPQDPEADPADSTMILLIPRDIVAKNKPEAYQVLNHIESSGFSATAGPHIRFTDFRVPGANLLAAPGTAGAVITRAFGSSAALVGAMATGIMAAAFEAALTFAKSDSRGGAQALLARQSVSDILMNVKMRTDAARAMTWVAASAWDNGRGGELALETKIYCSELAVQVVTDAMLAVGVSSYNKDSPFPKLLNDAMCLPLTGGGNVGIRRRQLEQIFIADDYKPWAASLG
ncbi:acyl-CoA dehydrogenase domain-containing protein [Rhexocercosporidium sp. MPI-PUGE-AT-0058]|nr:acyl-CoA dehydrogenase domain-containing protein [Rhexocercosporidium sp. MPI-PUGE-AT-0058]